MRSVADALRSVKDYVYEVLGEPWEVRLWAERGEVTSWLAVVKRVGPTLQAGTSRLTDLTQPLVVYAYPEPQPTVEESLVLASGVEQALLDGFGSRGAVLGRPRRIPLWDYDGVPATGVAAKSEVRYPSDFLRVVDCGAAQFPDDDDPRRIAVTCDLRISWRRTGRLPYGDRTVRSVTTQVEQS